MSTGATPTPSATWSAYAVPGEPCHDDDWIVDIIVVEVNVSTRVVTTRKVCDVAATYAGDASEAADDPLDRVIAAGFGYAAEPRTPHPYTLRVPQRHVHRVRRLAREGEGMHPHLEDKARAINGSDLCCESHGDLLSGRASRPSGLVSLAH